MQQRLKLYGWKQDKRLSALNNRTAYRSESEKAFYLVDTQYGKLEKLDFKGKYLGEFDFSLNQTKLKDMSEQHDLKVIESNE